MSLRVDTSPLISGALVCGNRGLGVLGSAVPSTGDNGAGYLYNDLSLPADANKEVRGLILTQPSAGTLYAYEDSSFEFTGAPDGSYTFTYRLYVDGADTGVGTVNLQVGSPVAVVSATTSLPAFSGSASQSASAAIAAVTGLPVFAGVASVDGTPAEAAVYAVTRLPTFSGGATSGSLTDSQKLDLIISMLASQPSAESIAAAVLALAQITPIHADLRRVTGQGITGAGTEANPWGPA